MPRAGPVGPVARPAACQTNRAGDRLDRLLDLNRATAAGHGPVRLLASCTDYGYHRLVLEDLYVDALYLIEATFDVLDGAVGLGFEPPALKIGGGVRLS